MDGPICLFDVAEEPTHGEAEAGEWGGRVRVPLRHGLVQMAFAPVRFAFDSDTCTFGGALLECDQETFSRNTPHILYESIATPCLGAFDVARSHE